MLWVILCAAVAVFAVILVIIVMCLMNKKLRPGNVCEDASNDIGKLTQPDDIWLMTSYK